MRLSCLIAAWLLPAGLLCAEDAEPPCAASPLTPQEIEEGFVSLFDGKTLDGWQGSTQGYVAEQGIIVCKKEGGGRLFTKKDCWPRTETPRVLRNPPTPSPPLMCVLICTEGSMYVSAPASAMTDSCGPSVTSSSEYDGLYFISYLI